MYKIKILIKLKMYNLIWNKLNFIILALFWILNFLNYQCNILIISTIYIF